MKTVSAWYTCRILLTLFSTLLVFGCSQKGAPIEGVGGADISQLPARDQIIQYAARGDIAAMENILVTDPKALNSRSGPRRWTPLHMAAANGQKKAVQFLLEKGANPRIQDEDGYTAADIAGQEGHSDIEKMIEQVAANAEASSSNDSGE